MAQYYWEADSADEGALPSNATVTEPWHSWDSLTVESTSSHIDFSYGLRGAATALGSVRRLAAFSAIGGNSLTQSGVTQIYGVVAVSRSYVEAGIGGRISGNDTSETGIVTRAKSGGGDTQDVVEYDNASGSIITSASDTLSLGVVAFRMEFDGSTVKSRWWDYDTTEDTGSWDATDTTSVTGDGDWGMFSFDMDFNNTWCELLAFGFGNDGDPAPTEAVSGGASTESVTHTASAGDTFAATVTASASITEGVSAGDTESAIASVSAAIIESVSAGDSSSDVASLIASLTAGASANDTESALADAAAAIIEGATAGESWVARADALAQIIESAQGGETITSATEDLETALLSEGSSAAESFLAAATSLGLLSGAASAADSYVSTLSVIASISEGATASASFVPTYEQGGYLLADSITVVAALSTSAISVRAAIDGTVQINTALSGTINVKPR